MAGLGGFFLHKLLHPICLLPAIKSSEGPFSYRETGRYFGYNFVPKMRRREDWYNTDERKSRAAAAAAAWNIWPGSLGEYNTYGRQANEQRERRTDRRQNFVREANTPLVYIRSLWLRLIQNGSRRVLFDERNFVWAHRRTQ